MDILIFGIQGSGKGTQGKILAQHYGFKVFEMGGELRAMIQSETPLGNEVKEIVESGHLVQTSIIMRIVSAFLDSVPVQQGVVFDGIPRTQDQAEQLEEVLRQKNRSFHALLIQISQEEAMKRLTTRRICSQCKTVYPVFYKNTHCESCGGPLIIRQDDTVASIEKRLTHYYEDTLPIIENYRSRNLLVEVNGEQSIERVTGEMLTRVAPLYKV